MSKIFWGAVFVLINTNVKIGNGLDLLPDFVGYVLMIVGAQEMQKKLPDLYRLLGSASSVWKALILYSGVFWVLDLLGISLGADVVLLVLEILAIAGQYYGWFLLVSSLDRLGKQYNEDLNTKGLITAWWISVIAVGLEFLFGELNLSASLLYSIVAILVLTAPLYFLFQLYKSKKSYESLK